MTVRFIQLRMRASTAAAVALLCAMGAAGSARAGASLAIDMVTIDHAGNAADPANSPSIAGIGAVGYNYRIGTYEVTNAQYATFLNAVAASDPYGLYNTQMALDPRLGGIVRGGIDGQFSYTAKAGYENAPVTYVSFWDSARFVNWMNNGQGGAGTTETGAYTLNGVANPQAQVTRNANATYYLPSISEWYKAAYYDPTKGANGGYWQQATRSDVLGGNRDFTTSGNRANYFLNNGDDNTNFAIWSYWTTGIDNLALTAVGTYKLSSSYFGTYDQAGNVFEMTDTAYSNTNFRWFTGGSWSQPYDNSQAGFWGLADSTEEGGYYTTGFRIAAGAVTAVPEPTSAALWLAGLAVAGTLSARRRRTTQG